MNSISTRFNVIFFFGLVVLTIMCTLNYLTGLYFIQDKYIDSHFEFLKHKEFFLFEGQKRGAKWDKLLSTFSLKIDKLKNLDNWNLKQFFVYLEATWEEKGKKNEVIFWDRIISRKDLKDSIVLNHQNIKYPICDLNLNLKGKVITVNLWIEQVPVFGWIHRRKYGSFQNVLPLHYF